VAEATDIWTVDDTAIGTMAREWAQGQSQPITPAAADDFKVCLMLIDMQITFCSPSMMLFCSGDSGLGAAEDVARVSRYIYQNIGHITECDLTLDTHYRHAIFHQDFWVDREGNPPPLYTLISADDVANGVWIPSSAATWAGYGNMMMMRRVQRHVAEYTRRLADRGRYPLIMWPQHAKLGNVEHAVASMLYEAVEWHAAARMTNPKYEIKGADIFFEMYSAISTEVEETCLETPDVNTDFLQRLLEFDMVIAAGEAASHCFAWTIEDMLRLIMSQDPALARKFVLLRDGTSSVVIRDPNTGQIIPGSPTNPTDFRPMAAAAFQRCEAAGMRIVTTQTPIPEIPGYGIRS
jgi:nicotinamidase-related amidase